MNDEEREQLVSEGAVGIDETCKMMGLKRTFVYALMALGELRYAKIGRRRVVPRAEIRRFLAERLVGR